MREKQVPQHLSMVAAHDKAVTLARLSVADKLGIRRGFAGGWTDRGGGQQPGFTIPPGHVITHIGDTDRGFGTYMADKKSSAKGDKFGGKKAAPFGSKDKDDKKSSPKSRK